MNRHSEPHRRATVAFGWVSGAALGLILSYVAFLALRQTPLVIGATFLLVGSGCIAGMQLGDRLGTRGFRPLGMIAGVLMSIVIVGTLLLATRSAQ